MPASDLLTVRVDESGDAGTGGRGTRWLVLGAAVEIGERGQLSDHVETIRQRLGIKGAAALHFSRIRRAKDQYGAYLTLSRAPFDAIVVAADSHAIFPDSGLTEPAVHYRYALRFVLERASQIAMAKGRMLEFVVEESGHFELSSFQEYVRRMRASSLPVDRIEWDVVDVDLIRTARKDEDLLLGVADGVAHAYFRALEPMPAWGTVMPIYGDMLQPRLWRGPAADRILGNGLTLLPTKKRDAYLVELPYLRSWAVDQEQVAPLLWHPSAESTNHSEGGAKQS